MQSVIRKIGALLLMLAMIGLLNSSAQAQSYKGFPRGYCTWYAATEFDKTSSYKVNWSGNAADWASNASRKGAWVSHNLYDGYRCCNGTIVVWTGGSDGYGHVAIVRSCTSAGLWVQEMNWTGFNQVSSTFLSWNDIARRGRTGQYRFAGYIINAMWA